MKKIFALLFILLFISPLVLGDVASSATSSLEQNVEKAQTVSDAIEKSQDTQYWEEKWDYLGSEWKSILLKNPFVSTFDSFFTAISVVFEIILGIPYSLSFLFFGALILWVFIYLNFLPLVGLISFNLGDSTNEISLSGGISYLMTALFCIILAQFKFFESVVNLLGRLAFSPEYVWTRLIVMFVIVLCFGFLSYLDKKLSAFIRLKKKNVKEKAAEVSRKTINSFAKSLLENTK